MILLPQNQVCCKPVTWADKLALQAEVCFWSLSANLRCSCKISRFRPAFSGCNRLMTFQSSSSSVSTILRPAAPVSASPTQAHTNLHLEARRRKNQLFQQIPSEKASHIPTIGSFGIFSGSFLSALDLEGI
jgi:hypothetical protein